MAASHTPDQQRFPLVTVVVLNYNGRHYLERCLSSVLAQTYPCFEVVLVDNGSTDDSVELARDRFPQVRIIQNVDNLGFAAGNNRAIRACDGKYVATLNNDTQVESHWLEVLVQVAESDARVGMCASKMLLYDQPETIDSAGIELDLAGIAWNRQSGEQDRHWEASCMEVFGPCAGAALYRREMLDQVGLFDEDYFAYYEDVDLAWRARLAGWRCLYTPAARVYHVHSATLRGQPSRKLYLLGRNKVWTVLKNQPLAHIFLLPFVLLYDVVIVLGHLMIGGEVAPLRGRMAAWRGARKMWRKRRQVQRRRAVSWVSLLKLMRLPKNPVRLIREHRRSPLVTDDTREQ